ncbi:hypothetical protein GCM10023188_16390 [Pontibacter saemangeumensis]|uniref:Secretion system C-terminal sorting domain-containing protein n=2 Tax=Pontibacter saemangeumensis TaxID=1084525 RepID=A0ABP8LIR3_9BACT
MGENVTEDFNLDDGGFTSDDFVWNASEGYWEAIIDRPISRSEPDTYTITSGVYTITEDGYVNYGFIFSGPNRIGISIIDANTGEVLAGCDPTGGILYNDQRGYFITCLRFPYPGTDDDLYAGREIQFVTTFHVYGRGFTRGRSIIYDNFSVGGSATEVGGASALLSNATSRSLLQKKGLSQATGELADFTLYPNPVNDRATLSFDKQLSVSAVLSLIRADGVLLRTLKLEKGAVTTQLDLSSEKPGLYIVTLQDASGRRTVSKLFKYD